MLFRSRIAAYQENDVLFIIIKDNGQGLSERKMADGAHSIPDPINQGKYSGIGLENVQTRIRMHFGVPFGMHIQNGNDGGAETIIRLPWSKRGDPPV